MGRARDFARGPQLRRYLVTLPNGHVRVIEAHYAFDNSDEGKGLVFRRFIEDNTENRTYVVATYAPGFWASFEELVDG